MAADCALPGPYCRRQGYISAYAADGTFIPNLVGRHRDEARRKQLDPDARDWAPKHPDTEPAWLFWRVVIEGVLTYSEADQLTLERLADALEAAQVMADLSRYNRTKSDG